MLKLLKFDYHLIISYKPWRYIYAFIMLILAVMISIATFTTIKASASSINIGNSLLFICNIFTFLVMTVPFSKHTRGNTRGDYPRIIDSLPIKKINILNCKFILLLLYTFLLSAFILLISFITCLFMGYLMSEGFILSLLTPVVSSTLIFGCLYLISFFCTKNSSVFSSAIYFISMMSYAIYASTDTINLFTEAKLLLIISVAFTCFSYLLSLIFLNKKCEVIK